MPAAALNERPPQSAMLPGSFIEFSRRVVWGWRYPHHGLAGAWRTSSSCALPGVPEEMIASMMGGNAAHQFGVQTGRAAAD